MWLGSQVDLQFDGQKDPISFLEGLEELNERYSVTKDGIVKTVHEAFLWYKNSRRLWRSYEHFRRTLGFSSSHRIILASLTPRFVKGQSDQKNPLVALP